MTPVRRTLRLYLANRGWVLLTPLYILAVMLLISVAIAGAVGMQTGFPIPQDVNFNMRYNGGALYSVPGFLMSVGVLAMSRNFDMALALGATRRNFWLGTGLGFVLTSAVVGGYSVIFLGLERLTDHWFIGARAFDVALLGDGDPVRTFATMFLAAALSLFLGAFFGMVYRTFGTTWTSITAVVLGLAALAGVALGIRQWSDIEPLWHSMGSWLALLAAAVLTLVAAVGSYGVNRRATI